MLIYKLIWNNMLIIYNLFHRHYIFLCFSHHSCPSTISWYINRNIPPLFLLHICNRPQLCLSWHGDMSLILMFRSHITLIIIMLYYRNIPPLCMYRIYALLLLCQSCNIYLPLIFLLVYILSHQLTIQNHMCWPCTTYYLYFLVKFT